jgi:hypothetical protein
MAGFVGVGYVFAQIVHAYAQAKLVCRLRGGKGVFNRGSGDKAAGKSLPNPRFLRHIAQRFAF